MSKQLTEGSHEREFDMPREVRTDVRGDGSSTGKGEHNRHGKRSEYVAPFHKQKHAEHARKEGQ